MSSTNANIAIFLHSLLLCSMFPSISYLCEHNNSRFAFCFTVFHLWWQELFFCVLLHTSRTLWFHCLLTLRESLYFSIGVKLQNLYRWNLTGKVKSVTDMQEWVSTLRRPIVDSMQPVWELAGATECCSAQPGAEFPPMTSRTSKESLGLFCMWWCLSKG